MFHRDDNELGAYNDDSGDESYQETDTESDRDEPEVYDSHNADDFDHLNVVHDLDDTVHEGDMDTSISAPGRPPTRRAARKDKRYTVDVDEVVRKALRKNCNRNVVVLAQNIARLVCFYPSCPVDSRGPFFYKLPAKDHLVHLRQLLEDWDLCGARSPKAGALPRLPIEALIAVCMNEYSALVDIQGIFTLVEVHRDLSERYAGRVRHPWGVRDLQQPTTKRDLYFALRAWSEEDRKTWNSWTPQQRANASSVLHPFHWQKYLEPCHPLYCVILTLFLV